MNDSNNCSLEEVFSIVNDEFSVFACEIIDLIKIKLTYGA